MSQLKDLLSNIVEFISSVYDTIVNGINTAKTFIETATNVFPVWIATAILGIVALVIILRILGR